MSAVEAVGFIGLGNMGGELAANLVGAGFEVVAHDAAGASRLPAGATWAPSVASVAARAEVVVLSLPDGAASTAVTGLLAGAAERRTSVVVDTSTVGVTAARALAASLAEVGIAYVDAPVSGGAAGARARTLMVMVAGPDEACARVEPVLAGLSDQRRRVGDRAGLAQALKLANNFLSATALAATSEALAFGTEVGLDPAVMIEVLDASSGRSSATADKFPNHVLTETYASGFTNTLMAKDLTLYRSELTGPSAVSSLVATIWQEFAETEPGADFTRIHPHLTGPPDS